MISAAYTLLHYPNAGFYNPYRAYKRELLTAGYAFTLYPIWAFAEEVARYVACEQLPVKYLRPDITRFFDQHRYQSNAPVGLTDDRITFGTHHHPPVHAQGASTGLSYGDVLPEVLTKGQTSQSMWLIAEGMSD